MLTIVVSLLIFSISVFLYQYRPRHYISYTLWVWFLVPEVRRLVDYYQGYYNDTSLLMLTPYLVTGISLAKLINLPPSLTYQEIIPFFICIIGLTYSFLVGIINTSATAAIFSLLNWLIPIVFGFYLFASWRSYPQYRHIIQRTFLWGVLVMGIYGLVQFITAPPWDQFWMIHSGMESIGTPAPFEIRVFSTLNSPGPFANVLSAGLLLLFNFKGGTSFIAAGSGYLSFLLSMVRAAWLNWLLSLFIFANFMKLRFQFRLVLTVLIVGLLILPIVNMEPFANVIKTRFDTISNIQNDTSFSERSMRYTDFLKISVVNPLGTGLGVTGLARSKLGDGNTNVVDEDSRLVDLDSGVLDIFLSLGWFGGLPYLWGLIWLVLRSIDGAKSGDIFANAACSIVLSNLVGLIGGNSLIQVGGIVSWGFLGISLAASKYHRQNTVLVNFRRC